MARARAAPAQVSARPRRRGRGRRGRPSHDRAVQPPRPVSRAMPKRAAAEARGDVLARSRRPPPARSRGRRRRRSARARSRSRAPSGRRSPATRPTLITCAPRPHRIGRRRGRARAGSRRAARGASRPRARAAALSRNDARPRAAAVRPRAVRGRRPCCAASRAGTSRRPRASRGLGRQRRRAPWRRAGAGAGAPRSARAASSTTSARTCSTIACTSWMRWVSGAARPRGRRRASPSVAPPLPVSPIVRRPSARAARSASSTLRRAARRADGERHVARARRGPRPAARKTASKPRSLPTAVTIDGSVVRAIAESARRSCVSRTDELGREVLRVGRRAAVAEREQAPAGEQDRAPMRSPSSRSCGAVLVEEALLERERCRRPRANVVDVHVRRHYARRGLDRGSGGAAAAGYWSCRRCTVSRIEGTAGSSVRTSNTVPSRVPAGTWTGTGIRRPTLPSPTQCSQSNRLPPVP